MTTDRTPATPGENHSSAVIDAAEAAAAAAEADAVAAEADARAAAARARAIRSRAQATTTVESTPDELTAEGGQPPRRSRSLVKPLAAGVAVVLLCACLAGSGYLMWRHHGVTTEQQRTAEFNAAARQGVVNLMSVDFATADQDVKRLLDSSTGKFKDDLTDTADTLTMSLQQAKVKTTVTVDSTAVESMSADTGVVLVAASSEAVDTTTNERKPAKWRVSVTLTRDGGQLKMSQVDFVAQ